MASGSKSSTSNQSTQQTNTRNLNLQDIEGTTIVNEGGGSVVFTATDAGAIAAGRDIGLEALGIMGTASRDGFNLVGDLAAEMRSIFERSSDSSDASVRSAFDLSDRTLDFSSDVIQYGSGLSERMATEGLKFATSQSNSFLDAVSKLTTATQDTIGQTVSGLNAIAKSQNTSADERVAKIAQYALIGAALIGAAMLLKGHT